MKLTLQVRQQARATLHPDGPLFGRPLWKNVGPNTIRTEVDCMSALIQAGTTPGTNVITVTGEAHAVPGVATLTDTIEFTVVDGPVGNLPPSSSTTAGQATTLGLTLTPL